MDPKVADSERFNKQTSYQDLLLENAELRSLFRDFLHWHDSTQPVDSVSFQSLVAKLRAKLQSQ
jgi:hypothetical protein